MPVSKPRSPKKCSGFICDFPVAEEAVGADIEGAMMGASKPALPARRFPAPVLELLSACTCDGEFLLLDFPNGFMSDRNVDDVLDWLSADPAAVFIDHSFGDVGRSLC